MPRLPSPDRSEADVESDCSQSPPDTGRSMRSPCFQQTQQHDGPAAAVLMNTSYRLVTTTGFTTSYATWESTDPFGTMTLQSLKTELPMNLTSYRVIDFVLRYPQLDGSTHEASIPVGLDDDSGFQFMKEEFETTG
ncbi:hypothetical protein B0T11DRAFT_294588 [Plectosphaerella cucumerina]|uniref:Uncharacterized protein n=1 Tax=Plectosphaerella cucumerina TaxID=40658 RepID=A0A8K0XAJ2_9PEZI|nr:hypothetical protein B0T11DRAFT_294588 [Plectosphaerella cucumerina]